MPPRSSVARTWTLLARAVLIGKGCLKRDYEDYVVKLLRKYFKEVEMKFNYLRANNKFWYTLNTTL